MPASKNEKDVADVKEDLAALRKEFAALVADIKDAGSGKLQDVGREISERARHRAEQIREGLHEAEQVAEHAAERSRDAVRAHPLSIILGAVGLGFLVGRLLNRRS